MSTDVYRSSAGFPIPKFLQFASRAKLAQVWWRLREKLDRYMEVAKTELDTFQHAFLQMESYASCSAPFSDMVA